MTGTEIALCLQAVGCALVIGAAVGTFLYGAVSGNWRKPQNRNYRR